VSAIDARSVANLAAEWGGEMNRRYGWMVGAREVSTGNDRSRRRVGPLKARCLLLLAVCVQLVSVAKASEYRLAKGKQYPLCQALQENFAPFALTRR